MTDSPRSPGVHILPTTTAPDGVSETGTDRYWALEGFDMRAAVSRMVSSQEAPFPETRIELPSSFDLRERYDFVLVGAPEAPLEDRYRLMLRGVEEYFGVSIAQESRSMDVYVLAAPDGQHTAIRNSPDADGGWTSFASVYVDGADFEGGPPMMPSLRGAAIGDVSVSNSTMDTFCHTLEQTLDRPVVDETGFTGRYDIEFHAGHVSTAEFIQALRQQLGLALTPARRDVTIVVVRAN